MTQTAPAYRPSERLSFSHATDSGGTDSKSADAYLIFPSISNHERTKNLEEPIWYVLLAHGVGNDAKGRIASQLAVEVVYKELMAAAVDDEDKILYHLEAAFRRANQEIQRMIADDASLAGMAAALLAGAVAQNRLYVARVGNCSTHVIRNGMAVCLTQNAPHASYHAIQTDHTAEIGSKPHAAGFAARNSQSLLGIQEYVEVDTYLHHVEQGRLEKSSQRAALADHLVLQKDDVVLFCSSGLSTALSAEKIANVANLNLVDEVAEQLIAHARDQGVDEDATALVVEWKGGTRYFQPPSTRHNPKALLLFMGILLLVGALFVYNSSMFLRLDSVSAVLSYIQPQQDDVGRGTTVEPQPSALRQTGRDDGVSSVISNTSSLLLADQSSAEAAPSTPPITPTSAPTFAPSVTPMLDAMSILSATIAPTETSTPIATTAATATIAATATVIETATAAATSTFSAGATPTSTRTAISTQTATSAPLPTQTPLPTRTPLPTMTPLPTATPFLGLAPTATVPAPPAASPTTLPIALPTMTATSAPAAPTELPTATTKPEEAVSEIYILKKDDNLWTISFERGLTVEELLAANPQIRDKDQVLQPGMAIIIPLKPTSP